MAFTDLTGRLVSTTQNVKSRWSLTGGVRLRELKPYWVKRLPHYHMEPKLQKRIPCFKRLIHVKSRFREIICTPR